MTVGQIQYALKSINLVIPERSSCQPTFKIFRIQDIKFHS